MAERLRALGLLGPDHLISYLGLGEPSKDSAGPAAEGPRTVIVQVADRRSGSADDLTIRLPSGDVTARRHREDVVGRLTADDGREGIRLLAADTAWAAALGRRGLGTSQVSVGLLGPGVLGLPWERPGHRYGRFVPSLAAEEGTVDVPVEGIVGVVDFTDRRVVAVVDAEPEPPPLDRARIPIFRENPRPVRTLKWLRAKRPYRVDGNTVTWSGWRFRFGMDPREGLVLSDVAFGPPGRPPIRFLTRASLAEMLVPYGDPSAAWAFRSIFDVGEFGLGRTAAILVPGQDLPSDADRFDAVFATETGRVRVRPGVVGLYQRDGGLGWRHGDRAGRTNELVLRFAASVGNYDYGFNWIFSPDGVLAMEIELTGQMLVKGVAKTDPRFGTPVGPHLAAIVHQHFFNFRLDFDVAGRSNRVREIEATVLPADSTNPHGTAFAAVSRVLARESDGRRDADPSRGRAWVVENPHLTDSLGESPGYQIVPGPLPSLAAAPEARVRQRGAFATHALWVTRWKSDERYAAGEYPGQDPGGAGLPQFGADDEPIDDADLVAWYSIGLTHFPRAEEWPLMPVTRVRFELRPTHFLTMAAPAGTGAAPGPVRPR